jgi:hypothetical protein
MRSSDRSASYSAGPFDVTALTPVSVSGITNATAISAGSFGECALLSGGNVDCWGHGGDGELGNSGFLPAASPAARRLCR